MLEIMKEEKEVLLIIDMQVGCFKTPRYDSDGVISRINQVSQYFRLNNIPVVFIQHNGVKEDYLLPGTNDFDIVKELVIDSKDYIVEKKANGAFYKTKLKELLDELDVSTLYITGLATDFCVNATIHSALVSDYNIVVISDCHTTADKIDFQARDIIRYHNFIWSNLTPTQGAIQLKNHLDVISALTI
ncbi:isochorismatase family protein [Vibrio sp. RC27]